MPSHFDRFVQPARKYPQIWRLLLGLVLIVAVYLAPLLLIAALPRFAPDLAGELALWLYGPWLTLAILLSFAPLALGAVLAARILHRRGALTLIGPPGQAARDFLIAAGVVLVSAALLAVVMPLVAPEDEPLRRNLSTQHWLLLLPLAMIGILIQTGAEELIFRGYIQQQLAARFRSPLIWMLLPSVLFGLLHWSGAVMGQNAWVIVAVTGLVGLIAADLTARTGTLGAAWGLHAANNALALLIVAAPGPLEGLSLWHRLMAQDAPEMLPLLLLDGFSLVLIWAITRRLLRR